MFPKTFSAFEFTDVPIPRLEVTMRDCTFAVPEMFADRATTFVDERAFEAYRFPKTFSAFEFTAVPIPRFEVTVRLAVFVIPEMFEFVANIFVVKRAFEEMTSPLTKKLDVDTKFVVLINEIFAVCT